MGYEHVLDAFLRSSVEFRRIKNAKMTAMRHRKWQEVRSKREQEEKKAAEEFLKRRKKERARLATYIYSSAQNGDRESCSKPQLSSQEHINKTRTMLEKKKSDLVCRENNWAVQKDRTDEDIIFDVCRLPTILVKEKPCDKHLPKQCSHAGDGQEKSADTADFLQEALQERLQNEAATSLLIAEITDMKARLDDLLAVPSKGHYKDTEEDIFNPENLKVSCMSRENDRSNATQLREGCAAEDYAKESQDADRTKCHMHQDYEVFAKENQSVNRLKCCMHNDSLNHAVESKRQLFLHASSKANIAAVDFEQDGVVSGKVMGSRSRLMSESEGSMLQQKSNAEQVSHKERVFSAKSNMSIRVPHANSCNYALISCHNQHEEQEILKRMSQELCKLEADRNNLASMEEDIHENTIIAETNTGCNISKDIPLRIEKEMSSKSNDNYSDVVSYCSPTHKNTPGKQLHCSKVVKDNMLTCPKSRKDSAKLLEFLNAENSLLASLERLDVKLAMTSANMPTNSSRTSLVSAGHQSTKSAPCVIRQKPGSDAYSINSTMFVSRPTTSQTGGVSLASRRRQNVGLTNIPKDRINNVQTCNMQQLKKCQAHPAPNHHKEERISSAGTIIVHQNAEFLFS